MPDVLIRSDIGSWDKMGIMMETDPIAGSCYLLSLLQGADGTLLPASPRAYRARVFPAAMIPDEAVRRAIDLQLSLGLIERVEGGLQLVPSMYWKLEIRQRSGSARRRQKVISRDGRVCYYCRELVAPDDIEVDHMLPVSRGGSDALDNLVVACRSCNQEKGTLTAEEFLALEA